MSHLPDNATVNDDDLDDLDDLLDEFQDEILSTPVDELAKQAEEAKKMDETNKEKSEHITTEGASEEAIAGQLQDVLNELDADPQAKAQFEALMKNFSEFEGQMKEDAATTNDEKLPDNLKDTISSTLNRLKESGAKVDQSIKDEKSDDLLENLLGQLSMADGEDGDFDIGNLLGELLDQLASKSVIYEPLKDLKAKYPQWIKENRDSISEEELTRYTKQSEIIDVIVAKFEDEKYTDQSSSHRDFISQKLEEMQNSGNPPEDLMGDMSKLGPGFNFDGDDIPEDFGKDMEKDLENCQQQ